MWDVVVLAALSAMERARTRLRAVTNAGPPEGMETEGATEPVEIAKAEAVTGFWRRLQDFAGLGVPRKGWREVGMAHPLLAVQGGRKGSATRLAETWQLATAAYQRC